MLEQCRHLVGGQLGVRREEERRGGGDLRRREGGALGPPEVVGPAVRVAGVEAVVVRRQRPRDRREDVLTGRGEVVVDDVAVGEERHRAVAGERAHADHVRERRRVARVRPRRRRRLVGVADGRDDHGAVPNGVLDRVGLAQGVGVPPRIARIAQPAEAEVDDPRSVVDGPADRGGLGLERDRAVAAHDFGDQELRREGDARDPLPVVGRRGDLSRDEGPVALLVGERASADEALRERDPARELRMPAVDAGIDDRDLHARTRQRRQLRPGVERLVLGEVPLLRGQRVVRREGRAAGRCRADSGRHEGERGERGRRPRQPFTTSSTRVVPGTKPLPATTRAR